MDQNEIVDKCLAYLMRVGLYKATSRELSTASDLNKSGLYYYFKSKDDVVLACAKRAIVIISEKMMLPTIKSVLDSTFDTEEFIAKANEAAPIMSFLIQVYSEQAYREKLLMSFSDANENYTQYAVNLARANGLNTETLLPYVRVCITTTTNYLIFGDETYIAPQFGLVFEGVEKARQDIPENNNGQER